MANRLCLAVLLTAFASPTFVLAQSDTTPPSLAALSFSVGSVDVSTGAKTLGITATITDNLSGVNSATISFTSPNGQNVVVGLGRTAGTNLNGTYAATAQFLQFAQPGAWTVVVGLRDNAGNSIGLTSATLVSLGFPGTMTVIDSNPDTTAPTLLGASFSPSTINTSNGPQSVTISLQVSDSQTGANIAQVNTFAVTLSPVGAGGSGPVLFVNSLDFKLTSGTPQNGVWQATQIMPQYSGGNWVITQVVLYDAVSNNIALTEAQLTAMGIHPVLADTSVPTDTTPPTLTGISFSPSVIDTSASVQNVTVTVSASDDLSGVNFSPTTDFLAFIQMFFTSPSGGQSVNVNPFSVPPPIAGTLLAGTWQFAAQWPQFSEQGTWTLSGITLKDKEGNSRNYSPAQLTPLGFPSTIVVTKPSLTPDGTIGPSGGTVIDNSFGTRASITFPPGLVSTPTTVSIDVFPSPLAVPTPRGFTKPGTYFENISFNPNLSEPIPAPGITIVLPLLTPMSPGARLSLYHIDPIVGLAPAMNAFGSPVVGTVSSDGVSAVFTNVVTFSTVVGYLSNGSVLGDVNGDGSVTCADVSILKSSFGKTKGNVGYNSAADLNNDGTVNILDLFIVSRQLPAGTVCQ